MTTVVIIGSAGRQADADKVSAQRFDWVISDIEATLQQREIPFSAVRLISGGAAFVDHAAVVLAKKHGCKLELCLPAQWDAERGRFCDTGVRDWRSNPGGTSNYYHDCFSKKVGRDSLADLADSIPSAIVRVEKGGFHARNSLVAGPADLLLAYTFSDDPAVPGSRGTLDTWNKSRAQVKIHKAIQ